MSAAIRRHDRRIRTRRPIKLRVDSPGGRMPRGVTTLDLSAEGAALEADDRSEVEVGDELALDLHLPGLPGPLRVLASVRWRAASGRRVGVQFRRFTQAAGRGLLAMFLTTLAQVADASPEIPEFDPNDFSVDLDRYPGDARPDERAVLRAFERQFAEFDHCVSRAKSGEREDRIDGDASFKVLLNPEGDTPLAMHDEFPQVLDEDQKGQKLQACLRDAAGRAPYPRYAGPPIVVDFEFEIDPGMQEEP